MSRRPLALTALIGVSLCAPVVARGSVVTPLDTRALVRLSPIIVRGEVETVLAGPNGSGTIDTWVSVSVEESLRGAEGRSHVVLRLPGGIWGDRVSLVHGTPTFRVGERVVVFATPTRSGDLTVAGLFQGKFRIEGTAGEEAALPDPGTGALLVEGPRGAGPAVREPLDHFLTHIRELVRFEPTRDGIPVSHEPALPTSAEPQPYFALLSSFIPLRWFEADSGTPVKLLLNTDGAPVSVSDAVAAFVTSLDHWTSVPGSTLVLEDGGATDRTCRTLSDGNVVSHGDPCGQMAPFDPTTCSGVVALTGVTGLALQTRVVGGVTFLRATEADVVFNAETDCFFTGDDGPADYEEVLSHEMGHVLGLGHACGDALSPACVPGSDADDALMRAFAHRRGRGGTPGVDDVAAARIVYPPAGFVDILPFRKTFTAGDTFTLRADLNGTATVDVYVLLVSPDGSVVSIAPGLPVGELVPIATNVPLAPATGVPLCTHVFTGREAPGTYSWVVLLVRPGADPTQTLDWLGNDAAAFEVVP